MRFVTLRLAASALLLVSSTAFTQSLTQASSSSDMPVQQPATHAADTLASAVEPVIVTRVTDTTSAVVPQDAPPPPPTRAERRAALAARHSLFDDRYHFGILAKIGTSGAGLEFGIPVVPHIAVRVGGDYIRYTGSYEYDAANIAAKLQFGYARASLDYFPWCHRRFHISPLLIVANQTHVQANVSFAQNTTFDFGGETFYSSPTDPLHGVGRVDLRKTSPGITVGFGNLTHGHGHWTFPVEFGAFYSGQPSLQVNFSGSVCSVNEPVLVGCRKVQDQADFQTSYKAFIARQNQNLTYAKWIPVVNFGVGYRF